jgi:hypothetical protein
MHPEIHFAKCDGIAGFLAAWIGPGASLRPALVLGVLLPLAGIADKLMIPPPTPARLARSGNRART